ncbi:MAG: ABC transporter ATP-binding protein [Thermoplasmata archaeon]|nr:ABC transporter ATP-binding protein [Thermoplasmata archaeon]
MSGSSLRVERLVAAWGKSPVLRDISFEVRAGETLVILGPNGSGKSTLLRCIAGLETPVGGRIWLGEEELTRLPTFRRGVGLVSQEPSLFLHRTVAENIAYGPELRGLSREETDARIRELATRLGFSGLLDRRPGQLSGGEQARVALARSLAASPRALLLDEPFAAIDPAFRSGLRAEFRSVLKDRELPVIHVTHDREEGLFLADRLLLLFDGEVHAVGSPQELFRTPRTVRWARFLGYNVLSVAHELHAVLPSDLSVVPPGTGRLRGKVTAFGLLGSTAGVSVRLPDGTLVEVHLPASRNTIPVGEEVGLEWSRSTPVTEETTREPPS